MRDLAHPIARLPTFRLEGRRALVTGAGVGIGLAAGQALAAAGASVVLQAFGHIEDAEQLARRIVEEGGVAHTVKADLRDVAAPDHVVATAVDLLGGLDIFVGNAGVTLIRPFGETDSAAFDELYALNVRAPYLAVRRALPELARSGQGSVIIVSSVHALSGFRGASAYAATKGALVAWVRELAIEVAPDGVRVNAVAPGLIEVPRYAEIPGYTTALGDRMVPIGRVGRPEEVAAAIQFLASEAAAFITGHLLVIDGGTSARMAVDWPGIND
jgi:glucose 1-dehydrogenase/3-oxoacyl-[acyl-carrier protein] reductase